MLSVKDSLQNSCAYWVCNASLRQIFLKNWCFALSALSAERIKIFSVSSASRATPPLSGKRAVNQLIDK
jgi:hypothetical protein